MPMGHTATAQAGSGGLTATEHRLSNGLRVVLSEDHLTPVAAVCLWYDVGSRHEVKGRTGRLTFSRPRMSRGPPR
ncbi:Putative Zn-dependent peptidase OS=Streptomyces albaduncus OX=68172 GN=FHS32_006183 PE=3 SV=1 [Streptomyces griseoloalbus]